MGFLRCAAHAGGKTLAERIERRKRLRWHEAVSLVRLATVPLGEAHKDHKDGIVHRDVKAENLFVADSGTELWVLDFGVAHLPTEDMLTRPGHRVGTPKFMAPEYLTGGPLGPEPLDGRADIYALGLVLAYAVGGRDALPAVHLGEVEEMLRAVQARPDVRKLAPRLPEAVAQVIDRATAVNPSARYQTMEEFGEALDGLLAQGSRAERWRRRARMAAGALGLAGVVFAAGYVTGAWREGQRNARAAVAAGQVTSGSTGQPHHGDKREAESSGDDSSQEGSDMNKVTKAVAVGTMVVGAVVATPKHGVSGKPPEPCKVDSDCKKNQACKPAGSLGNWCAKYDPKNCSPSNYRFTDRTPERLKGKCWVPPIEGRDAAVEY